MSKKRLDKQTEPTKAVRPADEIFWTDHLLTRRYRFPASGETERDFSVRIEHGGHSFFFPLGTSDTKKAAAKARQIYLAVVEQGWHAVCQKYTRELIVSFEWCMNPVLWSYTTIHTLVGDRTSQESAPSKTDPHRQRVLIVELNDGIRRALCWSIDQQPGFCSAPCLTAQSLKAEMMLLKPRVVLVNRNLASQLGFEFPTAIAPIQSGALALTYSVHADGDQMFVSTPGGAEGYLAKRIKPEKLLDPILNAANPTELVTEDPLARVKSYFQELLQRQSNPNNSVLAKLTRREYAVLALLSKGRTDKEIASALGISVWTTHDYIKGIFERLGVHNRIEAAIRFLEK